MGRIEQISWPAIERGSSNGVAQVSLPGGELLHFWRAGSGRDISSWINLAPDGKTALLPVECDGLFVIPLE